MKRLTMLLVAGILLIPVSVEAAEPFGTPLGSSHGVTAFSNGFTAGTCSPMGTCTLSDDPTICCMHQIDGVWSYRWQCVEYVRRWWYDNLGALVPSGDACEHWGTTQFKRVSDDTWFDFSAEGQGKYTNGTTTVAPQLGDLVVYKQTSYSCSGDHPGHVAVVEKVDKAAGKVYLAEQNVDNADWDGNSATDTRPYARTATLTTSGGSWTLSPGSSMGSFTVLGWRRSSFLCEYVDQSPSGWMWVKPGNQYDFQVRYRNKGIARWFNGNDLNNIHNVELWSCNSSGTIVDSWLEPVNWVNNSRRRATSANESSRSYNDVASFAFQARIPIGATTGNYQIYFRPTFGGAVMEDDWAGMYFPLSVDAALPNPITVSVNPTGCSPTNSFTFTWTASSDGQSGLAGYRYKIDNGPPSSLLGIGTLSVTLGAPTPGTYAFRVWAEDNVGNTSGEATANFCWQPTPAVNLSFDEDADANNIPDGWNVSNLTGYAFPDSGGADPLQPRYVEFTHTAPADYHSIGRGLNSLTSVIAAGQLYRLRLSYKTNAAATFGWRLGGSALTEVQPPFADNQWHTFWSAPFVISQGQIDSNQFLEFVYDINRIGTVGIDWVNFEPVYQCP